MVRGGALLGLASLVLFGCSADLHDVVGPVVPRPNLTGYVHRNGSPVADIKVKLEDTILDEEVDNDRTSADGSFAFSGVGAGKWRVRVDGLEDADFDRTSLNLEFLTADTSFVCPDFEVSMGGLTIAQPTDGLTRLRPTLFSPVAFQFTDTSPAERTKQVRVYRDEDGAPFWFSARVTDEPVRWNGLGNQGAHTGLAAPAGRYRWRLSIEPEDDRDPFEHTTRYFVLEFEE